MNNSWLDRTDNCATFLMTNIIPQTEDLKTGPWLQLEDLSQELGDRGEKGQRVSHFCRSWFTIQHMGYR